MLRIKAWEEPLIFISFTFISILVRGTHKSQYQDGKPWVTRDPWLSFFKAIGVTLWLSFFVEILALRVGIRKRKKGEEGEQEWRFQKE